MYETPSKHFRYDLRFLPRMMRSIVHDGINRSAKLRLEKQDSDLPTAGGGTKVVGLSAERHKARRSADSRKQTARLACIKAKYTCSPEYHDTRKWFDLLLTLTASLCSSLTSTPLCPCQ
jgi:hypothetical protein